jgi:nitrogen fixation/metabolism regulation signal transduction histidine kinase
MLGKTERRVALVILVTALLPFASAVVLAGVMLTYASSVWLRPEVDEQLERGIDLYKDYVRVVKDDMTHQADAIAGDEALRDAYRRRDAAAVARAFGRLLPEHPQLVSLAWNDADGRSVAARDRGRPLDDKTERKLEVRCDWSAATPSACAPLKPDADLAEGGGGAALMATFAFDRRYEAELARAGAVYETYATLEKEREKVVYAPYRDAFAAMLVITAVGTFLLGLFLTRSVTRRINRLAAAFNEVAAGNLEVRVREAGSDELGELARVFNRMLSEMQQSRARIEYLQSIGAWQQMAQRLAHEIKNPLTPIQLAVQECHRKYAGEDPRFRALLDTTLEIVEEEVGTLRRLVGNFSSFARLPHAELREEDLREFLRECSEQLGHLGTELTGEGVEDILATHDVDVRWEVPAEPIHVAIDRQMLRRVLINLVRNAVEAIRDGRPSMDGAPRGHVVVHAVPTNDGVDVIVEDDGPGVPETSRERVFDPYFTTKAEGTGLGLAIVKKIVVEHIGSIAVRASERLGGAAFVVSLPEPHSLAIAAARIGGGDIGALSSRLLRRSTM